MKHEKRTETSPQLLLVCAIAVVTLLVLFNQWQIAQLSTMMGAKQTGVFSAISNKMSFSGTGDLGDVDLSSIQNTAQAMAAVLPLSEIKDGQDAINKLVPTGTPEYGQALGVSYDQPVPALQALQRLYPSIKKEVQSDPALWQRYLDLATKPVGISCEYCCGVGPVGISSNGELACGCSHNPAIHALTLWLMKNTDMTDAEILQEDLRWKTLWFPRDMIGMAMKISGGDSSALNAVPGMVGGC